MSFITRGFTGRGGDRDPRLPPGQTIADDFPVMAAEPTPDVDTADWSFVIRTETGEQHEWDWEQFHALGLEDVTTDIHCVTHWSKLGTSWRGVSLDKLFENVESTLDYTMVHSYGGYTTNLPLDNLLDGQAWVATEYEGEPLEAEHGGPARLLVPHLYFWKSAKWVRGISMRRSDEPGFWESNGYHMRGDPWQEERYW